MNKRTLVHSYPSLADLINVSATAKSNMPHKERAGRSEGNDDWAGASWNDAIRMAIHGDLEGARRLHDGVLDAVNNAVMHMPRLDPVYKLDEGRWIDVARYVKGEPECWGDMVESEPMPRKGIAIIVNIAVAAGVSAKAIDKVGVALGSVVLGLQAQGYTVILYAAQKIEGYGTKWAHMIEIAPVNPGGTPLDVARMSAILRPWFLRRVIFSLEETFNDDVRNTFGIGSGYGRPAVLSVTEAQELTGQKSVVIIDIANYIQYPGNIRKTVLHQIKGA